MAGEKILVVEDSADVRQALEAALEDAEYQVTGVGDGDEALRAFYSLHPDLVLLDVLLPGISGIDICERIRTMSNVPVIIFSALANENEKLAAFEKGADDYVIKGVGIDELLARVKSGLRRARFPATEAVEDVYSDGVVQVDFTRNSVTVRGEPVDLTPTEYRLLTVLIKHRGQPFKANHLLHRVWGPEYDTEDLVKWHIGHLRRKIEENPDRPKLVVTRRGFGYVYIPQQESAAA